MSVAEIKATIDSMTDEERFLAAAYLQHQANERDAAYVTLLTARMEAMDHGNKVSWEDALHMHEMMEQKGM
ncbi:MAG: hypothetical protein U0984_19425 [Prosthecobacter sp.]|nr:hypothetical protein [Prosthecobacter sp.]